ncbi:MAG: DUF4192 domain-containing protein [Actinomycetota bacterium]|nr:DUF4192 domain-containing protein [Actinomycetota bacterium]
MTVIPQAGAVGRTVDRLVLSGPDALLASVPHLLGFDCQDSVVLVGLGPNPDDRRDVGAMVRLVQRFDTPRPDAPAREVVSIARSAVVPMARSGSTEVIVAVFGAAPSPGAGLPSAALVDDLLAAVDDAGLGVRDALFTDGTSRWSYGCDDPGCCPPQGRLIPEATRTLVAAEFAGVGAAMAPSRAALTEEIAPDPARVNSIATLVADAAAPRRGTRGLEGWRDRAVEHLAALTRTSGAPIGPEDAALALQGLADVRVRDTFLWDAAQPGTDTRAFASRLADLVRCAPPGLVAPAATVLAITQWTSGDGARANVALDRAAADDPDYSLAHLVGAALRSGLPPSTWAASLGGLDRDTCRHGTHQPTAPSPAPARQAPAVAHPPVASAVLGPSPGLAS